MACALLHKVDPDIIRDKVGLMAKTMDVTQLPSEVPAALIDREEAIIIAEQAGREVGVLMPIRRWH